MISVSALSIGILSFNPFDWSVEAIGFDGLWLIFGMFSLGVVSWFDDIKPVSRLIRFVAHTVIVVILLIALFSDQLIFQGLLPIWLDRIFSAVLWLWFINLSILWTVSTGFPRGNREYWDRNCLFGWVG